MNLISRATVSIQSALCAVALLYQGVASASGCDRVVPNTLNSQHQIGHFLLHYTESGGDAIANPEDVNRNGIPDMVEDAGAQLQVMHDLLMHFGFSDPLLLDRYASQGAKVVHVRFLAMKGNGLAMDEPRTPRGQACGLLIDLSSQLKQGNLTPAHEYFHLVQYAYAPYKRGWYLEGMARWSETLLGRDVAFNSSARSSRKVEPAELFEMRYDAYSSFWQAFARDSSEPNSYALPKNVAQARYTNGEVIVKDNRVYGVERMKAVLVALGKQGLLDSERLGLDPAAWPEKIQRDPAHDPTIWKLLQGL